MRDIQDVTEALLARWPNGFRNKHLAQALGVSRARASKLLAYCILAGELVTVDEGRRKYMRGPDSGHAPGGVARGDLPRGFWRALAGDCPCLGYVALRSLGLSEVRTRQQVRAVLRGLDYRRFLVVDFEGVHSISDAASRELFLRAPEYAITSVQPINLEPIVASTVRSILRLGR